MIIEKISEYFEFVKHKTNVKTEVLAGVSTFLALSYIFIVNPAILAEAGMSKGFVLFATIIASFLATFAMGILAKKPFVLAPGLEMNAYVAFFVVASLGFSWQAGLGAVFWSGILFMVLTALDIRQKIITAIPDSMKGGLALSVGVFLALIAFKISGMLLYEGVNLSAVGSLLSGEAIVVYFGLMTILVLERLKIRGSVLISIILSTIFAYGLGLGTAAADVSTMSTGWFDGILQFDIMVILDPRIWSAVLVLFLVDFYGSVAKFIGLTRNTSIVNKDGTMPQMKEALSIDGIGTIVGSALGTTSITTYVESGVGIGAGGRTGLTAVVCSLLMLSFLLLSPVIGMVPVIATGGALLFVGITLLPSKEELGGYTWIDKTSVILMAITVLLTFALDKAMLVGFGAYIMSSVIAKRKVDKYLVASTILLLIGVVLQLI
ncbi:NCS2 family permease [Candidatus Micrarchaeota archaeon]|nr:NCS2 family permease [Candidatus Micrarchaeota archaeon]